ncbi:hypothetical protein LX64_04617 [Chitinophaga skermanii]|uniref:Uncharacterized protein n=1 Tax=Chitinophaga skermanii TaxID=331697 RepID=A0A327Q6V0_9BACT|nr:hypothetical protein [Chitinophaga skermanii]RAI99481.1 hypothetical protein LX64_04617 [Chitinophaga skermanii]
MICRLEIAQITFNNQIETRDGVFLLGNLEEDLLVMNKQTEEVCVYEFDNEDHLLWQCAESGQSFLHAILIAWKFILARVDSESLWEDESIRALTIDECVKAAGDTDIYRDFYEMIIG